MDNTDRIIDVTAANLDRLGRTEASVMTRRNAHLRELIYSLGADTQLLGTPDAADEIRRRYADIMSRIGSVEDERIVLCSYIPQALGFTQKRQMASSLLAVPPKKRNCTISYVHNALGDLAFGRFSESFDKAGVSYVPDFAFALEDVYHSKTDYAILPQSSRGDGRMLRFGSMIEKYELKTALACTVYPYDDDSGTTFVLVSKNTEFLFSPTDMHIRFDFLISDASQSLGKVLRCAEYNKLPLVGVYTDGADFTDGGAVVSLDVTSGNLDALITYLYLEIPRHTALGIYKAV